MQGSQRVLSACYIHQKSLLVELGFVPAHTVQGAFVQHVSAGCLEILTELVFSQLLEGRD